YSRYAPAEVATHRSLDAFFSGKVADGIHAIAYGDGVLDLQLVQRESRALIVAFHAAVDPAAATLPVFTGRKVTQGLDASVLFVSDPSLERGMSIGWFAGDSRRPLQTDLVRAINHVSARVGAEQIIFEGCSAGGFAALYYSHQLPGSLAIAMNPQTDFMKYYPRRVREYVNTCWPEGVDGAVTADLVAAYASSFPNNVLYLQNRDDAFHIQQHYRPWGEALAREYGQKWCALPGDWGSGHAAPPSFVQEAVLAYALSFGGDWEALMRDEEFRDGMRLLGEAG
ncbi:hypothetical protein, partial [Corynebacterium sp. HMSC071B10]|uniref:hypothetical protein n=1 Tax=Corynebacterium sp. HMSC071B10 TaxID=1739494 RepID=UPI0008A10212